MTSVSIIGAGNMGTAIAAIAANVVLGLLAVLVGTRLGRLV